MERGTAAENRVFDEINNFFEHNDKIFCSEAHFQFELGWFIKEKIPESVVLFEFVPDKVDSRMHVDIVVKLDKELIPIELKYKTTNYNKDCKNTSLVLSSYHNILKKQSAQNYGRYYYLKDVQRITELVQSGCYDMYCGFAVFLTNDHLYWNPPKKNKNDIAFRLDKDSLAGFPVSGRDYYSFAKIKKPDNTKNSADTKNKNLEFKGSYDIQHWNIPEGKVDENDLSKFYYMITTIRK